MNDIQTQRTPDIIGAEIRGLTQQAKTMTLWFGIEIGRRLTEAKEMLEHGQWLPYLKEQTEFSRSSAGRLMTLYKEYGAAQTSLFGAESNYPTLNNLSISNALRLLAVPEDEREEFAAEHDVEHMSARELDELIKQRNEAEKRAARAEEKAAELERLKKSQTLNDPNTAVFKQIFEQVQEDFNKLHGSLLKVRASDPDTAQKLTAAVRALVDKMQGALDA